jgi:hypothetical protein
MRYFSPDLEGNKIAYKGRRFWVIELLEGKSFEGWKKEPGVHFVIYDRRDVGIIATVAPHGTEFMVETALAFGSKSTVSTLKEATQTANSLIIAEVRLATGDSSYRG